MKHENNVTLSIYVKNIELLTYDKETKSVVEKTILFYNEKVPSDNVLKKEISELLNETVVEILSVSDNEELSGTYKMSHSDFAIFGSKVGAVRGHKEKTE